MRAFTGGAALLALAGWSSVHHAAAAPAKRTKIIIEAESAVKLEHWVVQQSKDTNVGQGKFVGCLPNCPSHKSTCDEQTMASYRLSVPKRNRYYLWIRLKWPDNCVYLCMRFGRHEAKRAAMRECRFSIPTYDRWIWWHWRGPPLVLDAGEYVVELATPDAGISVDQLFLTDDPDYVPVRVEAPKPALKR